MRYGKMWTVIALGVVACTSSDTDPGHSDRSKHSMSLYRLVFTLV